MFSPSKFSPPSIVHSPQEKRKNSPLCSMDHGLWTVDCQGFTLVEVLVAIVILAFGLVTIVSAMGRTQEALRISRNLILAAQTGEEQIAAAEMKLREKRKLTAEQEEGVQEFPGKKFSWLRRIGVYPGKGIVDQTKLNQVDLSVSWKEGANRENKIQAATLLLNRPKKEKAEVGSPL